MERNPSPHPVVHRKSRANRHVPPLYNAMVRELRRLIRRRGWSLAEACDRAGLNDGHLGHILCPQSKSGRVGQWHTLDLLVEALAGKGARVLIVPADFDARRRRELAAALEEQHEMEVERVAGIIELAAFTNKVPRFA